MNRYTIAGEQLFIDVNAKEAMESIVTDILCDRNATNVFIIIDALDECVVDLPWLLGFISRKNTPSRAKWIVSSWNWPQIEGVLYNTKHQLCLELDDALVSAAVGAYIHHKVNELEEKKGYDYETRHAVETYLTSNANGTFLWVSLVCQQLGDFNVLSWNALRSCSQYMDIVNLLCRGCGQKSSTFRRPGAAMAMCTHTLDSLKAAHGPSSATAMEWTTRRIGSLTTPTKYICFHQHTKLLFFRPRTNPWRWLPFWSRSAD